MGKRHVDIKWYVYLAILAILSILAVKGVRFDAVCKYETYVPHVGQIALMEGQVIEQEFTCGQGILEGVDLYLVKGKATADIQLNVELYSGETQLASWGIRGDEVRDKAYNHFLLSDKLTGVAGQAFRIRLTSNGNEGAYVAAGSALSDGELAGRELYGTVLKEQILSTRVITKHISADVVRLAVIFVVVLIMAIAVFVGKAKMPQERRYLIFGAVVGAVFLVAIPYTKAPDEVRHFWRIFEISEGYLISDVQNGEGGRELPSTECVREGAGTFKYGDSWSAVGTEIGENGTSWRQFSNTSLYAPVSYLPQVIGVFFGKLLFRTVLGVTFMGKLFALLSSLAMVYLSIKLIPVKKMSLVLLAFMPMFLQESVSLAADCLINALAMLTVSYALYLAYRDDVAIRRRDIALIYASMVLLALCKVIYLPLCAVYFIIPAKKFGSVKRYALVLGGAMAIAVLGNLIWLKIASRYLMEFNVGVNSPAQIRYILERPFVFLQTIFHSAMATAEGGVWLFWFLGGALGLLDIPIGNNVLLPYAGILLIAALAVKEGELLIKKKDKFIAGAICLAVVALLFASLYVQWTPLRAARVNGVQGRYFIPVAVVLCTMFGNRKFADRTVEAEKYIYPFIGWVEVMAVVAIVQAMV